MHLNALEMNRIVCVLGHNNIMTAHNDSYLLVPDGLKHGLSLHDCF